MRTINLYTPIEACKLLKLDIDPFIDDWLEDHNVVEHEQCATIKRAIKEFGWRFFHRELVYHFMQDSRYRVYDDGHIQILGEKK